MSQVKAHFNKLYNLSKGIGKNRSFCFYCIFLILPLLFQIYLGHDNNIIMKYQCHLLKLHQMFIFFQSYCVIQVFKDHNLFF